MNITEANDVNTLLRWLGTPSNTHAPRPDNDTARRAAQSLGERAFKTLGAGLRQDDIREAIERAAVKLDPVETALRHDEELSLDEQTAWQDNAAECLAEMTPEERERWHK